MHPDSTTPDRVRLDPAENVKAQRLALAMARKRSRRYPHLLEEYESVALLGLVQAARSWDPGRSRDPEDEDAFCKFASRRIAGALIDLERQLTMRGMHGSYRNARLMGYPIPATESLDAPIATGMSGRTISLLDLVEADEEPVGFEIEYQDEVKKLSHRLPPRDAVLFRLMYGHAACQLQREAGKALGLTEGSASHIHSRACRILRESFGADRDERSHRGYTAKGGAA